MKPYDPLGLVLPTRMIDLLLLRETMQNLKKQIKERKFRHNPELLDEKMISSSQFSLLDSQETQIEEDAEDEDEDQDTVDNEGDYNGI